MTYNRGEMKQAERLVNDIVKSNRDLDRDVEYMLNCFSHDTEELVRELRFLKSALDKEAGETIFVTDILDGDGGKVAIKAPDITGVPEEMVSLVIEQGGHVCWKHLKNKGDRELKWVFVDLSQISGVEGKIKRSIVA